jgi:hypothetical protein
MDTKRRKTLERIFAQPVRADLPWRDVEALFVSLGAIVRPGAGSRVCVALNNVRAVFHRPHPQQTKEPSSPSDGSWKTQEYDHDGIQRICGRGVVR